MAEIVLELKAEPYHCEPCSLQQGTLVRELVRMIPRSVVLFDKLVGDEYYCCPICFEPKFTVRGKKKVNAKTTLADGSGDEAGGNGRIRVIK